MSTSFFAKVTTKNTWDLDFIDRFNTLSTNTNKTTFNNASQALDGSVKVFSTRVDDLTDNTNKLLNKVSEDATKRTPKIKKSSKKRRKTETYVEKEMSTIKPLEFNEYKYKIEKLSKAAINQKFLFQISKGYVNSSASLFEDLNEMVITTATSTFEDIDFTKPLTPFNETGSKNIFIAPTPDFEDSKSSENDFNFENEIAIEVENDYISESSDNNIIENLETNPFAYKNWGGPTFWKLKKAKKNLQKNRENKKLKKIDFTKKDLDFNTIFDSKNVFFSEEILKNRISMIKEMPEDNLSTALDLFSFSSYPGFFIKNNRTSDIQNMIDNSIQDDSYIKSDQKMTDFQGNNKDDEIIPMIENKVEDEKDSENENYQNKMTQFLYSKYKRTQKRVDMNRLKETLYDTLQSKTGEINEVIENLKSYYQMDEIKEISVQYCFISLLHLANEKGIKLKSEEGNKINVSL